MIPAVRTFLFLCACREASPKPADSEGAAPTQQDIVSIDVHLNIATLDGRADITVVPANGVVYLDAHGLSVQAVRDGGRPSAWSIEDGWLVVPTVNSPTQLEIEYGFSERSFFAFDGWMPNQGTSFLWPNHCANLFPCDPRTAEGAVLGLTVAGVPEEMAVIAPISTINDAPAYQLGFALGPYQHLDLGQTPDGTKVSAEYRADLVAEAGVRAGTRHLVDVIAFYEEVYGPYSFGDDIRTVIVDWGNDSYGGMEHHPYFHVAKWDVSIEEVHAHEAAHGWFGAGVRLRCWEDFVLSEGTTTYITARALAAVGADDVWAMYVDDYLVPECQGVAPVSAAWRQSCDITDFSVDPLWSLSTYMKGACFYGEVADHLGADTLDTLISGFYQAHQNQAAGMADMLQWITDRVSAEDAALIELLAEEWLLQEGCPTDYAARCRIRRGP